MKTTIEYDMDDILQMFAERHNCSVLDVNVHVTRQPGTSRMDDRSYTVDNPWVTITVTSDDSKR